MKSIGIMQPYFLPYIGYFQLICAVDEFVIYDNIQYTKQGWINRNRILQNGIDSYITLPLKKDSDFLDVRDRYLAESFNRNKLFRQIDIAYHKAPYYEKVRELIYNIIFFTNNNLFEYVYHSVHEVCKYLEIETPIIISSQLPYDNKLSGQDKVLAICKIKKADRYINAIGGMNLYHAGTFMKENMELRFIKTNLCPYTQFGNEFIPALSIIDVMAFNDKYQVQRMLKEYQLIDGI